MREQSSTPRESSRSLPFLRSMTAPLLAKTLVSRRTPTPASIPGSPTVAGQAAQTRSPGSNGLRLVEAGSRSDGGADAGPDAGPALSPAALLRVMPRADALAHDARNALTSLHLLAGLLAEGGVLAPANAHLATDLEAVADVLSSLIMQLAEPVAGQSAPDGPAQGARLEKSIPTAHPGDTARDRSKTRARTAGLALQGCARLLRTVAGSNTAVHISSESALPPLALEDDLLLRVLMNLVKNASEAMRGSGTVHVVARRALSRSAPAVLIHVSDNGPGIPAHALGSIFEPGFTSKPGGPRNTSGVACGLGLAIVRELVECAGGTVTVASTRRRGTTFELRIPCIRPEA